MPLTAEEHADVSGAVGAVAGTLADHSPTIAWRRLANVALGVAMAYGLTPPAAQWLQVESNSYYGGIAFLIGFTGMTVAHAIMNSLTPERIEQVISRFLGPKLPPGPPPPAPPV